MKCDSIDTFDYEFELITNKILFAVCLSFQHVACKVMQFIRHYSDIYRVAPQNGTVNVLGLCSDQQLSSFILLDRPCFPHYNNTKIIKFG